ncbi:MAG: universal stress protein, partial [Planctomycetota bacterium JB042]
LAAVGPTEELARALGARVTLIHVVPDTLLVPIADLDMPPRTPQVWMHQWENARKRLEEVRGRLADDVEVTTEVIDGESVAGAIVKWAKAHDADAICIASHGRRGLSRIAFGSVAEEVLRVSSLPVFVHPSR